MKNIIHFPARLQFDDSCKSAVFEVFRHYKKIKSDFSVGGYFEKKYTKRFVKFMNAKSSGYAVTACSGTAALFILLQAFKIRKNSEILVSSITDPGMINPIILCGFRPKLIDNQKQKSFVSLSEIKKRVSKKTSVIVLNHYSGIPIADIQEIYLWAQKKNIYLIEDCSQAHGAMVDGKKVGTFSDASFFSTMHSKNHSTGGTGAIIYTENISLYKAASEFSNKGKPTAKKNFNPKDPSQFIGPALNLKIDEISCAIGYSTLKKLPLVNKKRISILKKLSSKMRSAKLKTQLVEYTQNDAPYFGIFMLDFKKYSIKKFDFTRDLKKEFLTINADYKYIASDWPWLRPYLVDNFIPKNAINFRENSFNLLFNENFSDFDILNIVKILKKVEKEYVF